MAHSLDLSAFNESFTPGNDVIFGMARERNPYLPITSDIDKSAWNVLPTIDDLNYDYICMPSGKYEDFSHTPIYQPYDGDKELRHTATKSFRAEISKHPKYSPTKYSGDSYSDFDKRVTYSCKFGLEWFSTKLETKMHFVLDGMDLAATMSKTLGNGTSVTAKEFRKLMRLMHQNPHLNEKVIFWHQGKQVTPPWNADSDYWTAHHDKLPSVFPLFEKYQKHILERQTTQATLKAEAEATAKMLAVDRTQRVKSLAMLLAMELTTVKPADYDEAKAIIGRCSFLLGRCQLLKQYFDAHPELTAEAKKFLYKDMFLIECEGDAKLTYIRDCTNEGLSRDFADLCVVGKVGLNETTQTCIDTEASDNKYSRHAFTPSKKATDIHPELVEELSKLTSSDTYTP